MSNLNEMLEELNVKPVSSEYINLPTLTIFLKTNGKFQSYINGKPVFESISYEIVVNNTMEEYRKALLPDLNWGDNK